MSYEGAFTFFFESTNMVLKMSFSDIKDLYIIAVHAPGTKLNAKI